MVRILLFLCSVTAFSEEINFVRVPEEVVQKRLGSFVKKNEGREPALRAIFEVAGCSGEWLTEEPVKGVKWPNLVCKMPGAQEESIILVGAHFDSIEAGDGVVDNWSGASLLPSFYEGLKVFPRKHTFYFIGFSGEEKGLIGSTAYAKKVSKEHWKVSAMVNMDTLGLGETKVWTQQADPKLVQVLARVSQAMNLPASPMNIDNVGTTDSEPFRTKGVPAITIHTLTTETLPILHSKKDTIAMIRPKEYYDTYSLMLGYLAYLDQTLE